MKPDEACDIFGVDQVCQTKRTIFAYVPTMLVHHRNGNR